MWKTRFGYFNWYEFLCRSPSWNFSRSWRGKNHNNFLLSIFTYRYLVVVVSLVICTPIWQQFMNVPAVLKGVPDPLHRYIVRILSFRLGHTAALLNILWFRFQFSLCQMKILLILFRIWLVILLKAKFILIDNCKTDRYKSFQCQLILIFNHKDLSSNQCTPVTVSFDEICYWWRDDKGRSFRCFESALCLLCHWSRTTGNKNSIKAGP